MHGEVGQERLGNVGAVGRVGGVAVVAGVGDHPDLVLDLDQDHGPGAVGVAEVPHQRREGPGVGGDVRLVEGREDLERRPVDALGARKTVGVPLHPRWHVRRHAVLPRPEPQQHEPHVVGARLADQAVHQREVEPPLHRLEQLPVDRGEDRVQAEAVQPGPDGRHVLQARRRGVAELAAEHQERLAVDHELHRVALGTEMRQPLCAGGPRRASDKEKGDKKPDR